ncbi:MAG: dienelactone hydrolase family protein [Planctomycetota bacterium]
MTERSDVPWLAEVQTPPKTVPDKAPELPPLLVDDEGRAIATLAGWKRRRAELRRRWSEFLGTLRCERPEPKLEVVEEDRPRGCIRQLVRYESEPGIPLEGYLLKPAEAEGRRPGVVCLHSTVQHTIRQPAGVEGNPAKAFGLKLARRGVVAFCPKCFLWVGTGGYRDKVAAFQKRHPGCKGMAKMLWDAMRAVDILAGLPEVDGKRLGAVGHSLGGKEALYLAAFDERVRATVSSEGGVGISYCNWDAPWYLGKGVHEPGFGRRHHELLALAAPRPFLLVGGDASDGAHSWPYIAVALPVYRLYGAPPRLGLLNHRQGHSVPPQAERRLYEWLQTYL